MGKIEISYEEAKQFPNQIQEVMASLEKGTSKERGSTPEQMKWSFSIAESIRCDTLAEILQGTANARHQAIESLSLEEKLEQKLKNTLVLLYGKKGRWQGSALVFRGETFRDGQGQEGECPKQVIAQYRSLLEEIQKERERVANLTPDERSDEAEEALKFLRGRPGFMEIRMDHEGN